MMRTLVAAIVVFGSFLGSNHAQAGVLFFINDQAGFNSAVSALTYLGTEDFESSVLSSTTPLLEVFAGPLQPGVPSTPGVFHNQISIFPNGTDPILGLTFGTSGPALNSPNSLRTAAPTFYGVTSNMLATANYQSTFNILVDPPNGDIVSAMSFNTIALNEQKPFGAIEVYDSSDVLLGSAVGVAANAAGTNFFGVLATAGEDISRIALVPPSGQFVFVGADNVSVYTSPSNIGVTAAPEPSSLALFGIGTIGMFVAVRRKRKQAA